MTKKTGLNICCEELGVAAWGWGEILLPPCSTALSSQLCAPLEYADPGRNCLSWHGKCPTGSSEGTGGLCLVVVPCKHWRGLRWLPASLEKKHWPDLNLSEENLPWKAWSGMEHLPHSSPRSLLLLLLTSENDRCFRRKSEIFAIRIFLCRPAHERASAAHLLFITRCFGFCFCVVPERESKLEAKGKSHHEFLEYDRSVSWINQSEIETAYSISQYHENRVLLAPLSWTM